MQPIHGGELVRRRSRYTGTIVSIYDAHAAQLDPDGGPFVAVCEQHGTLCNFPTKSAAMHHLPVVDWCEECANATRYADAHDTSVAVDLPTDDDDDTTTIERTPDAMLNTAETIVAMNQIRGALTEARMDARNAKNLVDPYARVAGLESLTNAVLTLTEIVELQNTVIATLMAERKG